MLAVIILLPIIVLHLLFKIRTDCYWIQADWQFGDVLGYFGDVLSALRDEESAGSSLVIPTTLNLSNQAVSDIFASFTNSPTTAYIGPLNLTK